MKKSPITTSSNLSSSSSGVLFLTAASNLFFLLCFFGCLDTSVAIMRGPSSPAHHLSSMAPLNPRKTKKNTLSDDIYFIPTSVNKERGGAAEIDKKLQGGGASFATSIFNLVNNVAGAGMLTLAAGKASGGTGWMPSVAIVGALALASARTFTLIGKACELTGETSFKGLWGEAFGSKTAYIVDSIVFINCFLSSTIYIGLLGDIFSQLLRTTNLPWAQLSRGQVISVVAALVLFPLNLIKDLSSLAFTSILGLCAVSYTVLFMVFRALDGSYSIVEPVGKFIQDEVIRTPSFQGSSMWNIDLRALVLISNLGLAFIAHYNAPTYYREMKKTSSTSFPKMVYTSYAILAIIYVATMCAGYGTFGDVSRGNILLCYHPKDIMAFLGRLATGLSVVFGFPLVSCGAREGLKNASSALGFSALSKPENHAKLVAGMLISACGLAVLVEDVKLIAGFSGAANGSFVTYLAPTLVYMRILKKIRGEAEYKRARHNFIFVPFGLFIGVMGVKMTYASMKG